MKKLIAMLMLLMFVGVPVSANNDVDEDVTYKIVKIEDREPNEGEGLEEHYMTTTILFLTVGEYAEIEVDPINKMIVIQPKFDKNPVSDKSVIEFFEYIDSVSADEVVENFKYAYLPYDYDLKKNNYEFTDDDLLVIYHKGELIKGLDD